MAFGFLLLTVVIIIIMLNMTLDLSQICASKARLVEALIEVTPRIENIETYIEGLAQKRIEVWNKRPAKLRYHVADQRYPFSRYALVKTMLHRHSYSQPLDNNTCKIMHVLCTLDANF